MTVNELLDYIWDKRRQGLSDSQFARSLGMSLAHFVAECHKIEKALLDGTFKEEEPVEQAKKIEPEKTVKKKQAKKVVEETPKDIEGTPAIDLNDIL